MGNNLSSQLLDDVGLLGKRHGKGQSAILEVEEHLREFVDGI